MSLPSSRLGVCWSLRALLGTWLAPVIATGAAALRVPPWLAIATGIVVASALAGWGGRRLEVIVVRASRPVLLVAAVLALAAIAQMVRLSVFMIDARRADLSAAPGDPFRREHCCFTAYVEAERFARERGPNIYDSALYDGRHIGPLKVDAFHYPPPFLLAPGAVRAAAGDFSHTRSLWFALQAILLIGTVLAVGVWIGGAEGGRVLLAAPLMLVTPHFLTALQVGNFQSTAVCLSLLALILATGRRPGSAGALLGFAVVSKIFPGALVVHLAAGRRWRAVAWCAAFAILFPLAALAIYGWRPYGDFLHQELGRIASGAAFPQTERPSIIPLNLGIYGAAVKLRVLGASWLTPPRGRAIASVYGFLILVLAAWTGWRTRLDAAPPADRTGLAQLWLALLALASFRSPFVGSGYGLLATVWLVTLLAAEATRPAALLFWIAVLAAAAVQFWTGPSPAAGVPPRWALWSALLAQSGALAINGWVVARALARTRARVARVEIAAAA